MAALPRTPDAARRTFPEARSEAICWRSGKPEADPRMSTTVEDWLSGLGLGKYAEVFVPNDVDLRALPHLDEADLQELGVSLGHRKIIFKRCCARWSGAPEILPGQDLHAPAVQAPHDASEVVAISEGTGAEAPQRLLLRLGCLHCPLGSIGAEEMHDVIRRIRTALRARLRALEATSPTSWATAYWPTLAGRSLTKIMPSARSAPASRRSMRLRNQFADGQPFKARIGIATGRVVVGDFKGGGVNERGQVAGTRRTLLRACRPLPRRANGHC